MIRKVGLGKVGLDRRQFCSGVAVCVWGGERVSIPFKQYPKIIFEYYAKINRKSLNKNP